MLPAPLEESGTTTCLPRMRDRLGVGLVFAFCIVGLAACGGGERQNANEPEGDFPVQITGAEFPTRQTLARRTNLVLTVENTGDQTIPDLAVTIYTVANPEDNVEADAAAADPSSDQSATTNGEALADEVDRQLQQELQQATDESNQSAEERATDTAATTGEDGEPIKAAGAFSVISNQPGLEIPSRPVWILEQGFPRLAGAVPGTAPHGEIAAASGAIAVQTNTFAFGAVEPGESSEMVWQLTPVQAGTYTVSYRVAAGLEGKAVAVNDDGSVPEGEFIVQITDAPPQTRVNGAGEVVPIKPGSP